MKELSTEEKAKRYEEAIEKLHEIITMDNKPVNPKEIGEYLFPELKESTDEGIRESIAGFLKTISSLKDGQTVSNEDFDTKVILEWVAWLKKQSTANPYSGVSFQYNSHIWGMCARDNGVEISIDNELKAFVSIDKSFIYPIHPQPYLAPKSVPEAIKELKYKDGDWIVYDNNVYKIVNIPHDNYYECLGINNTIRVYNSSIDDKSHLWTIKDAKVGDVLANDHNILILKESVYDWYTNGTPYSVKAYCGIKPNGNFEIGIDNWSFCGTLHIHPATKEQRYLLSKKMQEEGYKWDIDKKELIKL